MNLRLIEHAEPLPGYRLIERLGRGGYGEVWKAEAPGGLFKAIKFVYGDLESAGEDNKGAEQELKAMNRVKTIRHPYILSIERFDIIEGQLMIVMELADRNLWDRFHECRNQGLVGVPRDELMRYLDETAEALDLMNVHHQIQHLDIKPQNLFLVHNHIKVADFGLAKDFEGIRATVTGGVTPVYAAPETFEGWISRYCDQYSLAIVYQELLTGVRPFSGTNTRHLLMQHISAAPDVSPLVPHEREVVARALAKKPEERFPTCTDFVKAIRDSANPKRTVVVPVRADDPTRTQPNFKPGKPNETLVVPPYQPLPAVAPMTPPSTMKPQALLKGLPRLVTPGTASSSPPARSPSPAPIITPVTVQRQAAFETGQISRLGIAPPERNGDGSLIPVYIVGVGRVGLQVMRRLRSYVNERCGRVTFPHWRWLFIDTDAETVQSATAASSGDKSQFFELNEAYHAKLQRPAHYLKRDGLPPPETWMSNEMLYRIPREPCTEGIRSLGRLALLDHYQPLSQRLRQDLETFLSEDVLLEADRQTKLGIRSNRPRVYLASSLCGGTGSGMLIDLAYIIRNEMRQMGFTKPQLTGLFLVPPVDRTTPKSLAVANTCTTLAELYHFSHPSTRYEARFDTRQPSIADPERPFDRCVLLSLPRTPSQNKSIPSADRAAGLIYQETLTPLGRATDAARMAHFGKKQSVGMSVQSFGYYRITWPRQRMLDAISERFAARIINSWCSRDANAIRPAVTEWFEEQWKKLQLEPAALVSALEVSLAAGLNATPDSLVEAELQTLQLETPTPNKAELPGIVPVIDRILQIVGKIGYEEEAMPGRITGILEAAVKPISKDSEIKFAKMAVHFVEQPQFRIAGAEDAIRQCTERLQTLIDQYDKQNAKLDKELDDEYVTLIRLLSATTQSAMFKGEKRRSQAVTDLVTWLRTWPKKRVQYAINKQVATVYRQMLGNAPEYLREMTLARNRLAELAASLHKTSDGGADAVSANDHPILPIGCKTIPEAADRLIGQLSSSKVREFEEHLQQQIRRIMRGLVNVCLNMNELGAKFRELMISQSKTFIDSLLGQHTPAEEFFRNRPDEQAAQRDILLAYDESTPEPFGPNVRQEDQSLLLGITADEYGKRFKATAADLIPEFQIHDAPSDNEIIFFREYHDLSITDVPQAGALAAEAIRAVKTNERITPASRTDVVWNTFLRE